MRYLTFSLPGDQTPRLGASHATGILDVNALVAGRWPGTAPASLLDLIVRGPDAWERMADLIGEVLSTDPSGAALRNAAHLPAHVRWHAPIPRPAKNIVCLGLNYVSHVVETTKSDRQPKIPEVPLFFTKAPTSVNGPYDPVLWDPSVTEQLDYEAELGVIIGVAGKDISKADALAHVFGYTVINDVSARDVQLRHKQWFKGKSLDGFCPMGPVVVTADEFGDPHDKHLTLRVNGETRQNAGTGEMIFPVDVIIEVLSRGMTIEPGDIIATGTPDGVGLGRVPPEYLKNGDVVETEVEGIGVLRNQILKT